jgi:hypothetical protein
MCVTAAPALAASIAELAICSGVTGTCGLLPTVSPAPVMAHVMKTSQFMAIPLAPGAATWLSERTVNQL